MKRLKDIKDKNKNYKVIPMALELQLNTKYSYDTINILKRRFPRVNFFLIIGADNFILIADISSSSIPILSAKRIWVFIFIGKFLKIVFDNKSDVSAKKPPWPYPKS